MKKVKNHKTKKMIRKIKKIKARKILLIVALALILRLITINQSFWLDEAINVIAARDRNLSDLLFSYSIGDFHPPLFHLLLWLWFKIFPSSEIFSRIPSLLAGVASVFLMFKVTQEIKPEWRPKPIVLLPALLLAVSPLHIYYSQEARMYVLACFLTLLSFLFLLRLRKEDTIKTSIFFSASLVLLLLSDYQPWFLLPIFLAIKPAASLLSILLTFPWWPLIFKQMKIGLSTAQEFPLWGSVVGQLTLKNILLVPVKFLVGRTSIDDNVIYSLVLLLPFSFSAVSIAKSLREKNQATKIVIAWLVLPLMAAFLVAIQVPIFSYFRFLFLLPAFYLLFVIGARKLPGKLYRASIVILLVTNLISTSAYLAFDKFQRENWRAAVKFINQYQPEENLVLFPNLAQSAAFRYYDQSGFELKDLSTFDIPEGSRRIFYVRYAQEIFDPQNLLLDKLDSNGFVKAGEKHFQGVVVLEYAEGRGSENSN